MDIRVQMAMKKVGICDAVLGPLLQSFFPNEMQTRLEKIYIHKKGSMDREVEEFFSENRDMDVSMAREVGFEIRKFFSNHRRLTERFFEDIVENLFERFPGEEHRCRSSRCPCYEAIDLAYKFISFFEISLKSLDGVYAPDFEEGLHEVISAQNSGDIRDQVEAIMIEFYFSTNPDMIELENF